MRRRPLELAAWSLPGERCFGDFHHFCKGATLQKWKRATLPKRRISTKSMNLPTGSIGPGWARGRSSPGPVQKNSWAGLVLDRTWTWTKSRSGPGPVQVQVRSRSITFYIIYYLNIRTHFGHGCEKRNTVWRCNFYGLQIEKAAEPLVRAVYYIPQLAKSNFQNFKL